MENWSLHVKKFGKIKSADVEIKPLTLFVGDNNAGKSYLLSLIWYLKNSLVSLSSYPSYRKVLRNDIYQSLKDELNNLITNANGEGENITVDSKLVEMFYNEQLRHNKRLIVEQIFNFDKLDIEDISIKVPDKRVTLKCSIEHWERFDCMIIRGAFYNRRAHMIRIGKETSIENVLMFVFRCAGLLLTENDGSKESYYFPAARTGFVLSRNIINQNSRRSLYDDRIDETVIERQQLTKPILQFLDMLELSGARIKAYDDLVSWIENNLAHGQYCYINEQAMEMGFVPRKKKDYLPMRASSAVVTELSPLVSLLKNANRGINAICYEEPEMCLHPQLQLSMGRCLIRLLNRKINLVVTTHSDIIVQHISNMCVLKKHKNSDELLKKLAYEKDDLMDINSVAVYQFTEEEDGSSVIRLLPENNSFSIPTFNNALSDILDKTIHINEDYFNALQQCE